MKLYFPSIQTHYSQLVFWEFTTILLGIQSWGSLCWPPW